jgi:hypothetical protein
MIKALGERDPDGQPVVDADGEIVPEFPAL